MPIDQDGYVQQINLAIDHIVGHLDGPLRLRGLARAALLSPFHIHRVFQALTGSTPADFVQRLRLEKGLRLLPVLQAAVRGPSQLL